MIRRPPRSTLFPSRRSSDLVWGTTTLAAHASGRPVTPSLARRGSDRDGARRAGAEPARQADGQAPRSEEHTSELQSRQYLVCRLLLEKKKNSTPCHST